MGMISDLYNDAATVFESVGYVDDDEFRQLVDELQACEKLLLERLDDNGKEIYETIKNYRLYLQLNELEATFVNAFRLGVLLMIDVYTEE